MRSRPKNSSPIRKSGHLSKGENCIAHFHSSLSRLRLDATHYIERMMIPPLERIFNLVGADVKSWYREMAKSKRVHRTGAQKSTSKPIMLEEHFVSDRCIACQGPGGNGGTFALDTCPLRDARSARSRANRPCRQACARNARLNPAKQSTPWPPGSTLSCPDNAPSTRSACLAPQIQCARVSPVIRPTVRTTTREYGTITSSRKSSNCPLCPFRLPLLHHTMLP